jgi:hypothetical protein
VLPRAVAAGPHQDRAGTPGSGTPHRFRYGALLLAAFMLLAFTRTMAFAAVPGLAQGASDQQRERQLLQEFIPCRIRQGHREALGGMSTAAGAMTLIACAQVIQAGGAPAPEDRIRSRSARAAKSTSTTDLLAWCGGSEAETRMTSADDQHS